MQNYILYVVAFFLPVFCFFAAMCISCMVSRLLATCQEHVTQCMSRIFSYFVSQLLKTFWNQSTVAVFTYASLCIMCVFLCMNEWMNISVLGRCIDRLHTGRPGFDSQQWKEIFLYPKASRLAPRPTQPPMQWGVKTITHLHLVPKSRIVDLYFYSLHTCSWRGV
jgi:hypothetical protein